MRLAELRLDRLPSYKTASVATNAPNDVCCARAGSRNENFLIGVSCHSLEAAKSAERRGADYLFFGPVFDTPSKAAYGPPQELQRLAEVCRSVSIPVLAIGGITLENCAACFSAGASGIAAIRLFQDAKNLPALVQDLRKAAT